MVNRGRKWEKVERRLLRRFTFIGVVELMFLGRFYHNLDNKGRLTIPARYRDWLCVEGAFVMQGFDNNLMVLPSPTFELITNRVNQVSMTNPKARLLRRLIFSSANRVEVDKVGRILVPQFLREAAGLETNVVIIGSGDYFEIWSPENWSEQAEQIQNAQSNAHQFEALDITSI